VVACERARSMQRLIPAIETSDGHHSSLTDDLKREICVSVEQKSREKGWPGWGRRFVMAWMADGLVENIVIWVDGWVFKYNWAWRMAEARAARSASKAVAVTPMCRVELETS
jgi:hypothetical protein